MSPVFFNNEIESGIFWGQFVILEIPKGISAGISLNVWENQVVFRLKNLPQGKQESKTPAKDLEKFRRSSMGCEVRQVKGLD